MKNLLLACLLSPTLALLPAQNLHSHLLIKPGKQFLLGGGQPAGFSVVGRNVGPVAVDVLERPQQGADVARGHLDPGQRVKLSFASGSAAVIRNASAYQAVLDLDVANASARMGMRYEPAAKNE